MLLSTGRSIKRVYDYTNDMIFVIAHVQNTRFYLYLEVYAGAGTAFITVSQASLIRPDASYFQIAVPISGRLYPAY